MVGIREFPYYEVFVRLVSPQSITHGLQFSFMSHENNELSPVPSSSRGSIVSCQKRITTVVADSATNFHPEAPILDKTTTGSSQWNSRRNDRRTQRRSRQHGNVNDLSVSVYSGSVNVANAQDGNSPYGSPKNFHRKRLSDAGVHNSESDMDGLLTRLSRTMEDDGMYHQQQATGVHQASPNIYLSLSAVPLSISRLFRPYYHYFKFLSEGKNLWSLLQGLFTGTPAFDLQLIKITVELVSKYNVGETSDDEQKDKICVQVISTST